MSRTPGPPAVWRLGLRRNHFGPHGHRPVAITLDNRTWVPLAVWAGRQPSWLWTFAP